MTSRAWLALVAALVTASCGTPLMKLPAGPGSLAADAANVLSEATATCRGVATISAELAVRGTVGGRRVRGRLLVGLAAPASAYLEAPAPFGSPLFIFAAQDDNATVLLPRDRRVLEHGQPAQVLESVAGVPLDPSALRMTLTGCIDGLPAGEGHALDGGWRKISESSRDLYVRRERRTDPWRLVAVVHRPPDEPEWRAEYRDFAGNLPRSVRLTSMDAGRFDLRLALSQVDINMPLDAETFRLRVPAGSVPMSMEELRDAGPLGGSALDSQ